MNPIQAGWHPVVKIRNKSIPLPASKHVATMWKALPPPPPPPPPRLQGNFQFSEVQCESSAPSWVFGVSTKHGNTVFSSMWVLEAWLFWFHQMSDAGRVEFGRWWLDGTFWNASLVALNHQTFPQMPPQCRCSQQPSPHPANHCLTFWAGLCLSVILGFLHVHWQDVVCHHTPSFLQRFALGALLF